jgi:putative transposase
MVPDIRETVERWSASGRMALVASTPKCDPWHVAAVGDCHDRAVVARQFPLQGRPREAEGAREDARLARFATPRPIGPAPPARRENARFLRRRPVHRTCKDERLPRESTTPREEQ